MMLSLVLLLTIMGVLYQFLPSSFVGGITTGIFMGMASLAFGFQSRLLSPNMPRK